MSILSKLFGGNQKRDTTYTGTKPVTSLSQVQGGQDYYDMIKGRTQGQGVGFGADYASKYANPIIANSRNQFQSYQLPELQSELSLTGRRRGSAGFDQIRRAYQEQGLNENDLFSRLQQRNEDQQRTEINDAMGRLGQYAQGEAGLVGQRAAFDRNDYEGQLKIADSQRAEGNAAFGRLLGTAALGIQGIGSMGGIQGGGMPQFSPTDYYSNMYVPWGQGGSMNDRVARKAAYQGGYMPYQTRLK